MHCKAVTLATLLFASLALAQNTPAPTQDKVFDFTNKPSAQGLQEIATVLRTVGQLQHVSVDPSAATVTVNGNTDQLAMAGWIVHELDRPAENTGASTGQYLVPPGMERTLTPGDDVIRVFFLRHTPTTQGVQEILTVLRTVGDVQKVFNYSAPKALVVRGPAAQIALASYLIGAVDVEPGSVKTSQVFQYQPTERAGLPASQVRVYYLANAKVPQQIQEILTVLRTVADIQKIFNVSAISALAIRGTPADLAVSEWIIQSLDMPATAKPAPSAGVREFTIPVNSAVGNIVRVFYPSHITKPQQIQQILTMIRTKEQVQKVFCYTALSALIVRGTADQITKSEQIILDQDQQAQTTP